MTEYTNEMLDEINVAIELIKNKLGVDVETCFPNLTRVQFADRGIQDGMVALGSED